MYKFLDAIHYSITIPYSCVTLHKLLSSLIPVAVSPSPYATHFFSRLIEAEYKQMVGNLEEVAVAHSNLVTALEEQSERPSREQRIGGAFLTLAPHIQNVHQTYCSNHPMAVCMLEKYK